MTQLDREEDLAGRVAIITGAASGIGRAAALLLASSGAAVACVDVDGAGAEETAGVIRGEGGAALGACADVSIAAEVDAAVARTIDEFGRIDVLFNNAGIGVFGKVHELAEADWQRAFAVNVHGAFLCSKAVVPHMLARGGSIVNTASTFALAGSSLFPGPAYAASKGAIVALTRQMAVDYGPAIRVNSISPGATATAQILAFVRSLDDGGAFERQVIDSNRILRRWGTAEEIARVVLFLASDDSSFVTGHNLVADGGQTVSV